MVAIFGSYGALALIQKHRESLEKAIGHCFKEVTFLQQALRHASFGPTQSGRFEFLGDAVLGLVIAKTLCDRFVYDEGVLSRHRAVLVKKDTLALIARKLCLAESMQVGPGVKREDLSDAMLADTLEAVLGAVYLDAGFMQAERVIIALWSRFVPQWCQEPGGKDAKTLLQEICHRDGLPLPCYTTVPLSVGTGFVATVEALDKTVTAEGSTKKDAQMQAALALLATRGL